MRKLTVTVAALALLPATMCIASTLRVPGQYATIQIAVDHATLGDTVLVAPGAYDASPPIVFGTKKNVRLLGEMGAESTTINGTIELASSIAITIERLTINGCVRISCNTGSVVSGCIVQHSPGSGIIITGCPNGAYSGVEISGCLIRENGAHGVEAELSGGEASISGNEIVSNAHSGISIVHSYCGISGNIIRGNGGNGISIDMATATILHNTVVENDGFGLRITIQGSPRTETINWNIVTWNQIAGVYGDTQLGSGISCNDVWTNGWSPADDYAGSIGNQTGLNGNISADPLFCDVAANDLSLALGSPALAQSCGAIGAREEPGCTAPDAVRAATWGSIKWMYR